MEEDEQKLIEQIEKKKKGITFGRRLAKVPPTYWIILLVIGFIGYYLYSKKEITLSTFRVLLGSIIFLVFIWLMREENPYKEPLTEREARALAREEIKLYQRTGLRNYFPQSARIEDGFGKLQMQQPFGGSPAPKTWFLGYNVYYTNSMQKTIILGLEPYKGWIKSIEQKDAGYNGSDIKDEVIVPSLTDKIFAESGTQIKGVKTYEE